MKTLLASTEEFIKKGRTRVAADVSAGSSVVVTVANAADFATNDYVVIGYEGSEQAELVKVTATGTNTITIQTLNLGHNADEPVIKYRYNKRKFYGCTTATGSFSELTSNGSPVTINPGDTQGALLEYTTGEGYIYFKATYYNSTTTEESNITDAKAVLADESSRYCSIYAIKKQAGLLNNPFIIDGDVEVYRKRAENEINSYLISRYVLPLTNASGVAEVPYLIENICTLLAAGYMDYKEFGRDGEGVKWLGEARGLLNKLQDGTQTLIGTDNMEMASVDVLTGVQSYPDQVDNNNGPTQQFTMNQKF